MLFVCVPPFHISGVPLRARFVSGLSKGAPKIKSFRYFVIVNNKVLSSEFYSVLTQKLKEHHVKFLNNESLIGVYQIYITSNISDMHFMRKLQ